MKFILLSDDPFSLSMKKNLFSLNCFSHALNEKPEKKTFPSRHCNRVSRHSDKAKIEKWRKSSQIETDASAATELFLFCRTPFQYQFY